MAENTWISGAMTPKSRVMGQYFELVRAHLVGSLGGLILVKSSGAIGY